MKEVDPRFKFAAERTMLAWMRTGLALMSLGFIVARYSDIIDTGKQSTDVSLFIGIVLLLLGVGMTAYSTINYQSSIERMQKDDSVIDRPWGFSRLSALILCLVGIALIYYVFQYRAAS